MYNKYNTIKSLQGNYECNNLMESKLMEVTNFSIGLEKKAILKYFIV